MNKILCTLILFTFLLIFVSSSEPEILSSTINLSSIDVNVSHSLKYDIFNKIVVNTYDVNGSNVNVDYITIDFDPEPGYILGWNNIETGKYSQIFKFVNRSIEECNITVTAYQNGKELVLSKNVTFEEPTIIDKYEKDIENAYQYALDNIYLVILIIVIFITAVAFFLTFMVKENLNNGGNNG